MIPDKLKDDFNSLRNMFDELKREIDKNVVREENYIYKENALTHIEVKQYDIEGNSGNDLIHIFQYQDDGALESITKSFPNGYSEIIYKTKRGC